MSEQAFNLKERIISIDALRGFAMFLILSTQIGGAFIFRTFINLWGENFVNAVSGQLSWANEKVSFINIHITVQLKLCQFKSSYYNNCDIRSC